MLLSKLLQAATGCGEQQLSPKRTSIFGGSSDSERYFGTVEISLFALRQWFDSSGTAL